MTMKIMKGHEGFSKSYLHELHVLHGEIFLVQNARGFLRSVTKPHFDNKQIPTIIGANSDI
jgi:hypothetical protein